MIAPIVTFAFDTLIWTGALIAAVLVLRRPVARWFGPGLAYALWLLPLARLALPPIVLPWALRSEEFAPVASDPVPAAAGADTMVTTVTIPAQSAFLLPWELLLTAAWLGGAALFLFVRWRDYRAMRARLLAGAVEVDRRAQPLLALHWFNPLAWAAWNAMRRDQEAACDARALAGADAARRAAYAQVIAGFAAGERLQSRTALAAPMACPISLGSGLGDKSIVHRLRSLTMTDIPVRRRRAGRWALTASAALALPLTATVVYAGQDAPERPAAPAAVAPVEPVAPAPPTPPATRKVEKRVIVIEHRDRADAAGDHDKEAKFERKIEKDGKTIVIRSDQPIDEAEMEGKIAPLLDMTDGMVKLVKPREPGDKRVVRKIIMHDLDGKGPHGHALAFALTKCKEGPVLADADASRESGDASTRTVDRTRILLCGKEGHGKAEALAKVRGARDRIAASETMSAEVRADILRQLDETIAKLEREAR
ncbi:MAG: M56 family metallopeptidase [Novosphingobium sp.]|nr:M56 family metallopeptidase [Novosphingobium sp.]